MLHRLERIINETKVDLVNTACARGISNRGLALMAGLHVNTLLRFGHEDWAPNLQTLQKLQKVLLAPDPE